MLWMTTVFAADLLVQVRGLDSDLGQVRCALYDSADAWLEPEGVVASVDATPVGGSAACRFSGVSPGRYAVSVLHDANLSGDMDWTLLGLPKESWGVSRDAPATLSRPRFEAAAFVHDGRIHVIHVR